MRMFAGISVMLVRVSLLELGFAVWNAKISTSVLAALMLAKLQKGLVLTLCFVYHIIFVICFIFIFFFFVFT